jgi:hypothetical protein
MTTEAEVLAAVLRLAHGRTDLVLWRNTVGHATEYDERGRARHITYGLGPGSPDVVGVLTVEGLAVWVAVWLFVKHCGAPWVGCQSQDRHATSSPVSHMQHFFEPQCGQSAKPVGIGSLPGSELRSA